jgi:hypothetical protein
MTGITCKFGSSKKVNWCVFASMPFYAERIKGMEVSMAESCTTMNVANGFTSSEMQKVDICTKLESQILYPFSRN